MLIICFASYEYHMIGFAYDYHMILICKGLHMSFICGDFPYVVEREVGTDIVIDEEGIAAGVEETCSGTSVG